MKKTALMTLCIGACLVAFATPAKAGSTVSISFSDGNWHNSYHWSDHKHHSRKAEKRYHKRKIRQHKRAIKRHKRALHKAHHRHHHNFWDFGYHGPIAYGAPHTTTYVYNYSEPKPVVFAPPDEPLLVNPTSSSYSMNGQTCREYQSNVKIGGRLQKSYGTACLGADGAWRIVD